MVKLIIHLDLTRLVTARTLVPSLEFEERWLGGRGFNTRILHCFKNQIPDTWSDEGNVVAISPGRFCGTSFPSSGRTTISVLKSPVSGMFSDGNFGGHFGPALKLAGISTLVLTGQMPVLGYVYINHIGVISFAKLPPGAKKWGCKSTKMFLEHKHQKNGTVKVLTTGAGAGKECFSAVVNCDDRVAGGGGTGAVLGSKNVKAIVVEYDIDQPEVQLYDEMFEEVCQGAKEHIEKHPVFETFKNYGTTSLVEIHSGLKYFPTFNFLKRTWKEWKKISGQAYREKELATFKNHVSGKGYVEDQEDKADAGELGCKNCPIICSNQDKIEYETLNCLGSKLGISDLDTIVYLNTVYFNDAGLDVIETTSVISALMEMSKRDLIDIRFDFGDVTAVENFLTGFLKGGFGETLGSCFREGFVLGLESAEAYGHLNIDWRNYKTHESIADDVYVASKGKAYSGVYPNEANKGVALATATSTRGADHLRALPTLATYASWYMGKGGFKKLIKLLTVPLRSAQIMKSDVKFLVGDLWETYEKVFGVPKYYINLWRMKGFLLDPKINKGWGSMIKFTQSLYAISDSLGTCRFTSPWRFGVGSKFWLPALLYMGVQMDERQLFQRGHFINLLEKDLLYHYGKDVKDTVPRRFFTGNGGLKQDTWDEIYDDYTRECDMDQFGKPHTRTVEKILSGDYMDRNITKYFEGKE